MHLNDKEYSREHETKTDGHDTYNSRHIDENIIQGRAASNGMIISIRYEETKTIANDTRWVV